MFRSLALFLFLYASFCQAEFVELDDTELSQASAQNGINISIDAGSSSEFSVTPTNTSADGSTTMAFTGVQTLSRNKTTGVVNNVFAPINVEFDISANNGSGDPEIVATINFNDVDAGNSTALKIGGWKLAASNSAANISAAPSLGVGYITDVTGSAVISVGLR